jgi:predicted nuclease of predicted toxin-antitoxin system
MKILADENITTRVCEYLYECGIDIVRISDIAKGSSDDEVMHLAIKDKRALLTLDKDFFKHFRKIDHHGIIWLNTSAEYELEVVKKALPKLRNQNLFRKTLKLKKENYSVTFQRKHYVPEKTRNFPY